MMTGTVTANREAVLSIDILNASGQAHMTTAIVDTGFTGWLTLPPTTINTLGLLWKRSGQAVLADGSVIITNVFEGAILWDGQSVAIPIVEADGSPLIGMSLMYGYELLMPILDGAVFTLRKISGP